MIWSTLPVGGSYFVNDSVVLESTRRSSGSTKCASGGAGAQCGRAGSGELGCRVSRALNPCNLVR